MAADAAFAGKPAPTGNFVALEIQCGSGLAREGAGECALDPEASD
jgi:hypothetical protein